MPTCVKKAGGQAWIGKYWISITDHREIRRRLAALRDRRQSEAMERRVKELVAAHTGHDVLTADTQSQSKAHSAKTLAEQLKDRKNTRKPHG